MTTFRTRYDNLDAIIDEADDVVDTLETLAAFCAARSVEPSTTSNVLSGATLYGSNPAHVPHIDQTWARYARGIEALADIYRR